MRNLEVLTSDFFKLFLMLAVANTLVGHVSNTHAADAAFANKICGVLKETLAEVRGYQPEGAQAQLVMRMSGAFDDDPAKLRQVTTEIDTAASASCPKEREELLTILQMSSLQNAVH